MIVKIMKIKKEIARLSLNNNKIVITGPSKDFITDLLAKGLYIPDGSGNRMKLNLDNPKELMENLYKALRSPYCGATKPIINNDD